MRSEYDLTRMYYEARLASVFRLLPSFALAAFIVGVALTTVFDRRWPNAGRYMLVAAAAASFVNVTYSVIQMQRARLAYKKSLEELRAISPEIAETMEQALKKLGIKRP